MKAEKLTGEIAGKSTRQVGMAEMLTRVARFKNLTASTEAFVDTLVPGHERKIYNVIGGGVTEDAALAPAIPHAQDFHVTFIAAEPGKGAALHAHPTIEAFMPLSGQWSVYWGDEGEQEIVLGPWDFISVPVGVMRGFRNVGTEHAHLMSILGGTDPGRVSWAPQVLAAAKKTPLHLDGHGNVTRI